MKREGLQFPVQDASPLIAPLHPDRSFGKYGERTLSHAQHNNPSPVTPLKVGWEALGQLGLDYKVYFTLMVLIKGVYDIDNMANA